MSLEEREREERKGKVRKGKKLQVERPALSLSLSRLYIEEGEIQEQR